MQEGTILYLCFSKQYVVLHLPVKIIYYSFPQQVEKQCAHFYSVTITEKETQAGLVCRVSSSDKSKFKVYTF